MKILGNKRRYFNKHTKVIDLMTESNKKKNTKYKPFFVQSQNPKKNSREVALKILEELIRYMMNEEDQENKEN